MIGVKRTACTAARSNREIVYTVFNAPFLVCACNRVLEARGVGGVTGNGNAYLFKLHYSNALRNVICAVAFNSRARTTRDRLFVNNLNLYRIGVKFGFNLGKAVNTRDYVSRVFTETVKNNAQGLNPYLICVKSNFNSALCRGKGFVTC